MTYIILNCIFLAPVLVYALLWRRDIFTRKLLITAIALIVLTAIFDNLIILAGIVDYDRSKILGWYIYKAPVEDFFYTFAVILLIPLLWGKHEPKK